jgi:hypothetical protein
MFPIAIGLTAFAVYIVLLFGSSGARAEISQADPDYARQLFNNAAGQLLYHRLPMRGKILFFSPIPAKLRSTIFTMRYLYAAYYVLSSSFFLYVVYEIVSN